MERGNFLEAVYAVVYPHISEVPFHDVARSSILSARLVLTCDVYCESYSIVINGG